MLPRAQVVLLACLLAACTFKVDYAGKSVSCTGAADCPRGTCSRTLQRCVPSGLESDRPVLSLVEPLTPSIGRVGTTFSFTVESSEPLERLPTAQAAFERGGLVTFTTADALEGNRFHFEWQAPSDVPQGAARIRVDAIDLAGNEGTLVEQPAFFIDTQPPRPSLAGLSLFPPPNSPLVTVDALSPLGRALVSFTFDEPLEGDVTLTASPPVLDCQPVTLATGQSAFSCVLDGGVEQEGDVSLSVRATDGVGNEGTSLLTLVPPLHFDTIAPVLREDAGLLQQRAPVATSVTLTAFQRVTGLSRTTEPNVVVQVFFGSSLLELTRGVATDAGAFSIDISGATDRPELTVRAIDRVGNLSPVVPVRSVEFHGVPGPTASDATTAVTMGSASARLERDELVPFSGQALVRTDGTGVIVVGKPSWLRRSIQSPPAVSTSIDPSLAFDEARASLVGQMVTSYVFFNGRDFTRPITVPVARGNAAISYDRRRGVMVVFGGTAATADVVELEQQTQRTILSAGGPTVRTRHALVWDGVGTQLLGGANQTGLAWRWDGQRWGRIDAGTMPMNVVAAAYDPRWNRVLALASRDGGSPETWRYDQQGWGQLELDAGPATSIGSMVWDLPNDRALFNGVLPDGGAEVYGFVDGGWVRLGQGLSTLRNPSASAFSPLTNEWLALAGSTRADLFAWSDDAGWQVRRRYVAEVAPPGLTDPSGVWLGGQLIAHGGSSGAVLNDTWRWDGEVWTFLGESPLPMMAHHMVHLPGRNEVLVVGGTVSGSNAGLISSAWRIPLEADGGWPVDAGWVELPDAGQGVRTRPTFVATSPTEALVIGGVSSPNAAFRYDGTFTPTPLQTFGARWRMPGSVEPGAGVLLSGGAPFGNLVPSGDGPLWLAGATLERLDAGLQRGRSLHSSVFDPQRGEHLLFGGLVDVSVGESAINEVVRVKLSDAGVSVAIDAPDDPEGDGNISVRHSHLAGWDDSRRRMLVFAGRSAARTENDVWEYLTEQHRPALVTSVDATLLRVDGVRRFSVDVTVAAGADSEVNGSPASGSVVEIFQSGRWVPIGQVPGSYDAPGRAVLTFETQSPTLFWSTLDRLAIRITPVGTNGRSFARLFVDELELTVRFVRE